MLPIAALVALTFVRVRCNGSAKRTLLLAPFQHNALRALRFNDLLEQIANGFTKNWIPAFAGMTLL